MTSYGFKKDMAGGLMGLAAMGMAVIIGAIAAVVGLLYLAVRWVWGLDDWRPRAIAVGFVTVSIMAIGLTVVTR